jgi:hypothetical protein
MAICPRCGGRTARARDDNIWHYFIGGICSTPLRMAATSTRRQIKLKSQLPCHESANVLTELDKFSLDGMLGSPLNDTRGMSERLFKD